jgi:hypothetical protein
MLDQLLNIVKQFGKDAVENNPQIPTQYNQDVVNDATHTIAGGFQNILAGGGFQSIMDLFKSGGNGSKSLLQSPIVSMMIGHFISKLVGKYNVQPDAASKVANDLIPNSIDKLIQQTKDPNNENVTMDGLIGSIAGKMAGSSSNTEHESGGMLQNILDQFTGNQNSGTGGGFDLQQLIGNITRGAQQNMQQQNTSGGGLMDLIKGFMS